MSLTHLNPTASFARPADTTAYAVGDLVANSTTAGSVVPLQLQLGTGVSASLRRVRLRKSSTSIANAQFRVHLFRAAPVSAAGDNAAISMTGVASYLGSIDVTMGQAFTDGAYGDGQFGVAIEQLLRLGAAEDSIYALLEARAAYAPANAETFTLQLEAKVAN